MSNDGLKSLKDSTKKDLEESNFKVETYGKYPAWSPDINDFTNTVLDIYKNLTIKHL